MAARRLLGGCACCLSSFSLALYPSNLPWPTSVRHTVHHCKICCLTQNYHCCVKSLGSTGFIVDAPIHGDVTIGIWLGGHKRDRDVPALAYQFHTAMLDADQVTALLCIMHQCPIKELTQSQSAIYTLVSSICVTRLQSAYSFVCSVTMCQHANYSDREW